jgi:hypothetical protein
MPTPAIEHLRGITLSQLVAYLPDELDCPISRISGQNTWPN